MLSLSVSSLLVALIIAAAAVFLGRRVWSTVRAARPGSAAGCGDGCGCGETNASARGDDWSGEAPRSVRG